MNGRKRITHLTLGLVLATSLGFGTVSRIAAQPPAWPDPVAEHVVPALSTGLVHGPMLGRPAATSVRVWVRTEEPMGFEIRYATQLPLDAESPTIQGQTLAGQR